MKPVEFLGEALEQLRAFPRSARREAGFQLDKVQRGREPDDWKPLKTIGAGVREIRVREGREDVAARHRTSTTALQRIDEEEAMSKKRFESIWDAIEDTAEDAAAMRARANLMLELQEHLRKRKLTQTEAARLLKVAQPRVSDLMRGRIDLFSTDMLIDMLGRMGARVTVSVEFKRAA